MTPKLFVGTSGWAYPSWRGSFYPKNLRSAEFLSYYAQQFTSVEINNTFYRMPKAAIFTGWLAQVPKSFCLVLKAPQRITHHARLAPSCFTPLEWFCKTAQELGKQLGPIFFQLPPNFKKDVPRLKAFLQRCERKPGVAIEFRHVSWFDDEVYALLRQFRAALCIADGEELTTPSVATAPVGYLRLRRLHYTRQALMRWHGFIAEQTWKRAYVFFKHEEEGTGPKLATRFMNLSQSQ